MLTRVSQGSRCAGGRFFEHCTDVDICVYGPEGNRIDCDTLEDNVPIVGFMAETDGAYRAVMTAASVAGGGTSYAGMVVLRIPDEGSYGREPTPSTSRVVGATDGRSHEK